MGLTKAYVDRALTERSVHSERMENLCSFALRKRGASGTSEKVLVPRDRVEYSIRSRELSHQRLESTHDRTIPNYLMLLIDYYFPQRNGTGQHSPIFDFDFPAFYSIQLRDTVSTHNDTVTIT